MSAHAVSSGRIEAVTGEEPVWCISRHNASIKEHADGIRIFCTELYIVGYHDDRHALFF